MKMSKKGGGKRRKFKSHGQMPWAGERGDPTNKHRTGKRGRGRR